MPRSRRISGLLASLSLVALAGCAGTYGFAGGGLPSEVRTVAVLPFDNTTPEPTLTSEVLSAVREAVENRLGLRQAGEEQADALVRGSIVRYDPDMPVAFTGRDEDVDVTRRKVHLTVNVEILNQATGQVLWQRSGLTVEGDYEPGNEAAGRERALDQLVTNIVEGAQSQW